MQAVVMDVDGKDRRISLSIRAAEPDPWAITSQKYGVGSVVDVEIVKLTEFGVFAQLDTGVEGLAHISELSDQRVNHPSEVFAEGDKIKMKIIKFVPEHQKISLSVRAYQKDQEDAEISVYLNNDSSGMETMGHFISSALKNKEANEKQMENNPEEPF